MKKDKIRKIFKQKFGKSPDLLVSAPGRVNLIGEHTDYNDGFVLPVAIDRKIRIAARKRQDRRVVLYSIDFDQTVDFSLDKIERSERTDPSTGLKTWFWANYPKGVAYFLLEEGFDLSGAEFAITGDIPQGAGLSSSAAFEVASALAFCRVSSISIIPENRTRNTQHTIRNMYHATRNTHRASRITHHPSIDMVSLALLCQKAENQFVGVNCGIMDQFISAMGKKDHALFLDCRSLNFELVRLNLHDVKIVVCNTKVKRELAGSEYNKRREQCERGVEILSEWLGDIQALRDVSVDEFAQYADQLPELTRKRCGYVIEENARVLESVYALKAGKLEHFGKLMAESHAGLRDKYEVSCDELDTLVNAALEVDGVIGARMTGAGFGGCTVNLVEEDAIDQFVEKVSVVYEKRFGKSPEFYVCLAEAGAVCTCS